jgi:hypothetical protein
VDFDDLMSRLGRYKDVERQALARFDESCRMRGEPEEVAMHEAGEP